ncbi:MAG: alanine racemase [Elusimicrobia bacterium]|nr:alanine racemase [Elusimicrobiota bacterium]
MHHLKWIEINLSAIADNLQSVRRILKPRTKLMGVVKADAYGHGALPVAMLLEEKGAQALGVLTLEEALPLRKARVKIPLALLAPCLPSQAEEVVAHALLPTVDSWELCEALSKKAKKPVPVNLDVDFGLGRWGIPFKQLPKFVEKLKKFSNIRLASLSTHLDYVPGKNPMDAERKIRLFSRLESSLKKSRPHLLCHGANSSLLIDFPHSQMDQVRIGNLLYGINPCSRSLPLQNPWQFFARIISIKDVAKGKTVGYGSEYLAPRRMRVATLPVGYADGLTMEPAERFIRLGSGFEYWGILRGHQAPFVGRCGIAHVLIDVTAVPSARLGDAVSLPIRRTAANPKIPRLHVR